MAQVGLTFDRIYRDNLWNGVESRSGPGSGDAATRHLRGLLPLLVDELGVTSVLDVGCGDGYWMPDLPGYVGIDASRAAIRIARRNHPDREYGTAFPARFFDLVIVRDVFQHLSLRDGWVLSQIVRLAATGGWLLASTFVGGENDNIQTGDAYSPDLMAPPFGLHQPDRLIFDGYGYEFADAVRDPRKHLGLWRL
jgi:SAM-dependent methyltransferase